MRAKAIMFQAEGSAKPTGRKELGTFWEVTEGHWVAL